MCRSKFIQGIDTAWVSQFSSHMGLTQIFYDRKDQNLATFAHGYLILLPYYMPNFTAPASLEPLFLENKFARLWSR